MGGGSAYSKAAFVSHWAAADGCVDSKWSLICRWNRKSGPLVFRFSVLRFWDLPALRDAGSVS